MKEITFLKQNYERWQQFEDMLNSKQGVNPDALADLFVRITDDLSWARTFYPGSNTEKYLNDLAARIHQEIYKNKKERRSRMLTFWTHEVPQLMHKHRLNLLIAFLIFAVSVWIGVISAQHDEGFIRIVLGDEYVDMTLENIRNGDPLGVYKQAADNQFVMFFQLAVHNSQVALLCVIAGLFGWLGVGFLQFRNGVMLGSFLAFLAQYGQFHEAMLTVWIHGVIEISSIVVAGAAGMAFGNGLWFPGAWPRGVSFARGTREAIKIGLGLIPFFFLAAFFEGFITRYTQMNDWGRLAIITVSLAFILFYFVVYPFALRYDHRARRPISRWWLIVIFIIAFPALPFAIRTLNRTLKEEDEAIGAGGNPLGKRLPYLNPMSLLLFMIGVILTIMPTIAVIMQIVTKQYAGTVSNIFFAICYALSALAHARGISWLYKTEEEDLRIWRRGRSKTSEYERQATSAKV